MLRVFYLDHTSKWSGGEIALFRTLSALDRDKISPTIVLAGEGEFVDRLKSADFDTRVFPLGENLREIRKENLGKYNGSLAKSALSYLRYSVGLAKSFREGQADIVHCNSLKSDIYGLIAGRIARKPVIWHVRDHIDPSYLPSKMVKIFRTLAKKGPDGVITNSISSEKKLFPGGYGSQKARVIYDGLMESELKSAPPGVTKAWKSDPPRIGLLGRIVQWKGQHVFLEAAQKLTEAGVSAEYLVIGSPLFGETDYEAQIKEQAQKLGERVKFLGFRSDVFELLRSLDILAHCSITPEPFGQVIIEGMAEGLPVVGSDGGGVQEIIEQGKNGLRVPMGDSAALADALGQLLGQPEYANQLGRAAHQRVRSTFTAAHSARDLEQFYHELLAKK
jgi:glycosyltransferase involved in cell wall biosynthesis